MKSFFSVFIFLISITAFSQDEGIGEWKGYFSYNKVVDIANAGDLLYVATENAFYTIDKSNYEMETFSTIDGLTGGQVSCAYFSEQEEMYVLGYENGVIQIFNQNTREITTVVEIKNKTTISGDRKTINHILEYNGYLYISCGFGVSVYDLANLEFDDTYYLGPNGEQLNVAQTAIYQGYIYAATDQGVYRALVSNNNIIDFANWSLVAAGNWQGITVVNGELVGVYSNYLRVYNGTSFTQGEWVYSIYGMEDYDNQLVVTRQARVYVLDTELNVEYTFVKEDFPEYSDITFGSALLDNGILYLGTQNKGVLAIVYPDVSTVLPITPSGPYFNNAYGVNIIKQDLWAVFGDYTDDYNPWTYKSRGISIYKNATEEWKNIPFDSLQGARNLVNITYSPNQVNEVFIASYVDGVLKVRNEGEEVELFTPDNSTLEEIIGGGQVRACGLAFDADDNLWVTNAKVAEALKEMKDGGAWASYDTTDAISDVSGSGNSPVENEHNYKELVVASNGYKFFTSWENGVIGFYENSGSPLARKLVEGEGNGNLPSADVRALAIDKNNQLWIGTARGLRVIYNIAGFFTSTTDARSIIIDDNGEASELMYQQWINDIFVDGSNNKWIGTADSGAFYLSSDGQETIYHFTTDNSPLPSNSVNQIVVNPNNGLVYFATDKGLVSFQGVATGGKEDYSEVYAFPNPVRPEYEGKVTITNLMNDSRVKITDVAGNLVFDDVSEGGSIQWDLSVFGRRKVASGVYLVLLSGGDGQQTEVCKIMVVR